MELRLAQETDLPDILDIYNDAIVNTTAVYHYEPQTLDNRRQWYLDKRQSGHPVVVLEDRGNVVGFAAYGPFRAWPAYKYTAEHSVYVHRGFRGRGAGKLLLQEIIRLAERQGVATLVAGIDAANEASIELHRKLGFTHSGTIRRAGFKFGRWLDLAFYQLDLPGPEQPTDG
ncbi:phosphinothricin acetyltransferase [Gordoniibacillus kamchatkensis]|uniref:Phosphinothricin acetyltransferase n=1 Tax=Gordoniibacillus kamchatkensis TaxID=1590651 RepID=A0ABR5A9Z6_9BACL|nr:GNAT family N-acetyltransferase [Paenibacillus sp. VKM B-2647]KIL37876.1 phosphinothricin acetyltransferase [Paenibacillus sp. VKM B-2647]